MQQTEQGQVRTAEPAREQERLHRPALRQDDSRQTLAHALQAVQAGIPLTRLPASMVLALSAQIGNSALLDLMAQQGRGPDTVTAHPPQQAVRTEPVQITAAPVQTAAPPPWAAMPAAQTAPASPSGLMTQGGVPYAGG